MVEEQEEYEEQICYKDYLNNLSNEELKRKDARDAKLWEKYKKDLQSIYFFPFFFKVSPKNICMNKFLETYTYSSTPLRTLK